MNMEIFLILIFFLGILMWIETELLKIYRKSFVKSHRAAVGRTRTLGIILACIPLLHPFVPQPRIVGIFGTVSTIIGILLLGIGIYLWARLLFVEWPEINKALEGYKQTQSSFLITTGLYSKVRNPIYTACFFTILGWYFVWRAIHGLLFMPVILAVIVIGTLIEEKYLTKEFGDEHRKYKQNVPMLFSPSLLAVVIVMLSIVVISIIFGWMQIT
jgi:protein-S-isoprenylcysteine O-methyltransferase Ste14